MDINEFVSTGEAEGWLRPTDNVNSVRVNGQNQDQRVYEVRVDKLHYNVQNGRIATFVSRYQMEKGALPEGAEARDDLIERMIEEDNPARLKTTKLDIKAKGQQEVAVILTNGVVIDGNRRFTCLRMLSREESQPRFLRCYVFPDTYDEKAIKGLELEIQLGRDEKVDYDPISRLVDIINTCQVKGLMTSEEYAKYANMKKSEMSKALREIDVLNDFLDFVNAPGAYHIAQDLKLQGVIADVARLLSKCKDDDEHEDLEQIVFANVIMAGSGDRVRRTREMGQQILDSERGDGEYVEEQLDVVERVLEKLEGMPEGTDVSTEFIRDHVASDTDLRAEQEASNEKARMKSGTSKIKNAQVRGAHEALGSLDGIDVDLLPKLSDEQLADMLACLRQVAELASSLAERVEGARAEAGR